MCRTSVLGWVWKPNFGSVPRTDAGRRHHVLHGVCVEAKRSARRGGKGNRPLKVPSHADPSGPYEQAGPGSLAGLDIQSRRDDLKVAQDVSPGLGLEEKRLNPFHFSRPFGTGPRGKDGASISCEGANDSTPDIVHCSLYLPQASGASSKPLDTGVSLLPWNLSSDRLWMRMACWRSPWNKRGWDSPKAASR